MTELQRRQLEIEQVELTPEEVQYAIFAAKHRKLNAIKNKDYWEGLEKQTTDESKEMVSYKTDAPSVQTGKNVLQKRSKKRWGKAFKSNKAVQRVRPAK